MLALFADGTGVLRNIGNWRVKRRTVSPPRPRSSASGAIVEEGRIISG
jgi:hypothetical protein